MPTDGNGTRGDGVRTNIFNFYVKFFISLGRLVVVAVNYKLHLCRAGVTWTICTVPRESLKIRRRMSTDDRQIAKQREKSVRIIIIFTKDRNVREREAHVRPLLPFKVDGIIFFLSPEHVSSSRRWCRCDAHPVPDAPLAYLSFIIKIPLSAHKCMYCCLRFVVGAGCWVCLHDAPNEMQSQKMENSSLCHCSHTARRAHCAVQCDAWRKSIFFMINSICCLLPHNVVGNSICFHFVSLHSFSFSHRKTNFKMKRAQLSNAYALHVRLLSAVASVNPSLILPMPEFAREINSHRS